ncbi:MAG: glycosyltransferase [Gemmatimonadetes bacterium]|nr:glycosyltransferase [Gemmatimonadota bacterium]
MEPIVSVVIPTYNHRDFILQTLESVFAQTFTDYEVVVVNDGSPDDTVDLLRPLAARGRIRVVEQPNRGMGAARNRGIMAARGQYIALLDDDDLWLPDKLEHQVRVMQSRDEVILVYGRHVILKANGTTFVDERTKLPTGSVHDEYLQRNWIVSPGQTLIRAAALRKVGGFDPGIWGNDDWELYIRLAREGEFYFEDRPCLLYRMHGSNASRGNAVRMANNFLKVSGKHGGWNIRLRARQLRFACPYHLPQLRSFARKSLLNGHYREAAVAYLYIGLFGASPVLVHLAHPRRIVTLLARKFRKPPPRGGEEA